MAFENLASQAMALGQIAQPGQAFSQGFQQSQQEQQNANILAQQQAAAQQAQAAQVQAQQQQLDVQHALDNPSAAAFSALQAKYPKDQAAFQASWNTRDKAAQQADLTSLGSVVASLDAGKPDVAQQLVQARMDADTAAGQPTEAVQLLNDALKSGDVKRARGVASYLIASAAGPEALSKVINPGDNTKVVGNALVGNDGKVLYQGDAKPEYKTIKGADGAEHLIEVGGKGSPASVGNGGFASIYSGWIAPTEGGYAARDGKSGAPVNFGINQAANPDVDVAKLDQTKAATLLHDRYWNTINADNISNPALQAVAFDTSVNMGPGIANAMLKASGGDVSKMLAFREQRYKAIGGPDLPAWLDRNAKLKAYVSGNPAGVQDVTPAGLNAGAATSGPFGIDPDLVGDPALKAMPPAIQREVQALLDGRTLLGNYSLRNDMRKKYLQAAQTVDPSFDQASSQRRFDAVKNWPKSPDAAALLSANIAMRHAQTLETDIPKVSGVAIPLVGGIINAGVNKYNESKGDVASYKTVHGLWATEVAKAVKGSGVLNKDDVDRALLIADVNGSNDEKKKAIGAVSEMLGARVDEVVQKYQLSTGTKALPPGLGPKALAIYRAHVGQDPSEAGMLQDAAPSTVGGDSAPPKSSGNISEKNRLRVKAGLPPL
jgi:hypothetical protein